MAHFEQEPENILLRRILRKVIMKENEPIRISGGKTDILLKK